MSTAADQPAETVSASTAARLTGLGRATMTRRLQAGQIPGATRDDQGHWSIPLDGLRAAGLDPDHPPADRSAEGATVTRLRQELAVAEALAAERAETITHLRQTLAALINRQDATGTGRSARRGRESVPATSRPTAAPTTPETGGKAVDISAAEGRILELRAEGMSFQRIADQFNAEEVPTARGGKWYGASVGKIHRRLTADQD